MKLAQKKLLFLYCLTFIIFALHFWINTTECKAYFMHDGAIEITPVKLTIHAAILFLIPAVVLFLSMVLKWKEYSTLFLAHYLLGFTSFGLLSLAINKSCEEVNGGHYMFINFPTALAYLLRWISYITLILLIIKTIKGIIKNEKMN
jgi:hypothetical protein